ncbi:long-chain fatty acid--CoA ligase [Conexibacter sp. SYSU D00693]|uniref:long-chain fatty acid--CoA ligase n=1 Tax=Conexibacter sp. SYSU D00693 TaxID=2812560 RepID=UPI001F11F638|nr:long-chain fatty acid--CoA ligase [Conexibacter sp. SYSU D00693]
MQPTPLTLVQAFDRAERMFADKEVVTATKQGVERTTYREWAVRTRRLAGVLDALGVSADGRVGTFAWNTQRHLQLYFAAPCSGRVLHTLNIRLFPEQVVYVANHAEDEVVFVDRSLIPLLWPLVDQLETVEHVVVMDDGADVEVPDDPRVRDYEELLAQAEPVERFAVEDEDQAAAMCYTSGTTGNPKGVVYSHRSMTLHAMATMLADTFGLSERDTVLPVVPMFHANAWGLAHAAVMTGSSLVLPGPDLSPGAIVALLEAERVTLTAGVPTIWMGMLAELDGRDLSALTRVVCGGSAVPRALSEAYREKLGRPILQAWGMTETSPIGSVARVKSTLDGQDEEALAGVRATAGLPAPLVEVRIQDQETGEELPWDGSAQGELQCRGPWIANGYYDDERSPITDDGWLQTGDVATIDAEGYIRLVDRTKDVIKSGGEWISSVELENEIMADDRVAEAAVIAVPDEKWGERPLACVVPAEGQQLTADDVRAFLDGRVARWWVPERVELIDEVPKTSVGKFSKKDLRARFVGEHATAAPGAGG